jgi:hypothetical protein
VVIVAVIIIINAGIIVVIIVIIVVFIFVIIIITVFVRNPFERLRSAILLYIILHDVASLIERHSFPPLPPVQRTARAVETSRNKGRPNRRRGITMR